MNPSADNFYAVWRERCRAINVLRDGSSTPPEKLLQVIWLHQRLHRNRLQTTDGRSVRVLHPGFASGEGGPDFRGAVVQFENDKPVSGDVEVDLQLSGWQAHGHDRNPNFRNVILHVVWEGVQSSKAKIPNAPVSLPLKQVLDAPLCELAQALENESGLPANLRGNCSAPLLALAEPQLTELLHAAAKVRFQNKAAAMLARARNAGWEQALWENIFRALGYKHNGWPMQSLAEMKSRWARCEQDARAASTAFEIQARLLGISGLLPADLTRAQKSSDTFLRRAWDCWWRERDEFENCVLPREIWKFHGLRPANHPQRRLALAAHWLAADGLVSKIEDWSTADGLVGRAGLPRRPPVPQVSPARLVESLNEILQVERDEFWSWHWTFKSTRLAKPQPLLGAARVTDLAVNVILPWLWVRAREGGNEHIQREMERRYFAWPAAEDNSLLKLARQRLLGTSTARVLKSAAVQQGLIQIVRDFCEHSNAICAHCHFPDLVRSWRISTAT